MTLRNLQQLLGTLSWIKAHMPDYVRVVAPLQGLLGGGLAELLKRSRCCSDKVRLQTVGCFAVDNETFKTAQWMGGECFTLDFSRFGLGHSDANDNHWAMSCVKLPPGGRWKAASRTEDAVISLP